MDGEIDRAVEQRFVDLLGEQPLAAEVAQRLVPDAVARRGDGLKRDSVIAKTVQRSEAPAHGSPATEQADYRACRSEAGDEPSS